MLGAIERARDPPRQHTERLALPRGVSASSEHEHLSAGAHEHLHATESPRTAHLEHPGVGPVHDVGHCVLGHHDRLPSRSRAAAMLSARSSSSAASVRATRARRCSSLSSLYRSSACGSSEPPNTAASAICSASARRAARARSHRALASCATPWVSARWSGEGLANALSMDSVVSDARVTGIARIRAFGHP